MVLSDVCHFKVPEHLPSRVLSPRAPLCVCSGRLYCVAVLACSGRHYRCLGQAVSSLVAQNGTVGHLRVEN